MTILITGANGFIASHLIPFLLKNEPEQIVGCVLRAKSHYLIPTYVYNLQDKTECEKLLKETKPKQIYHLAGYTNNARSFLEPEQAISSNLEITYNLLEALRSFSPRSRLLIASTSQVYAPRGNLVDESSPLLPSSPYALSKKLVEEITKFYLKQYHLDLIIVRLSNQIGPGQPPEYVASGFARQIALILLGKKPPELEVGNLEAERDFIDVRDSVQALHLIMKRGKTGEVYNLAKGELVSIKNLLDTLLKIAHLPSNQVQIKTSRQLYRAEPPQPKISTKKLSSLGFLPQTPLEKTLQDLLNYWLAELRASSS